MEKVGAARMLMIGTLLLRFAFASGGLQCEDLTIADCAFAVSSTGARCILEKSTLPNGDIQPDCQTSLTMAEKPEEWIESEDCINSCGLERESYGISTDLLLESGFAEKLCSAECKSNCPNIIDLYLKLAAGEGLYLPHLCSDIQSRSRRLIFDPSSKQNRLEPWKSSLNADAPSAVPVYGPAPAPLTS